MKLTLLELTQSILASLGSDEVNSVSDTTESNQVAEFIRQSYFNMTGRLDLPGHNQFMQLTPSNNPLQPTLMYLPQGVQRVEWIKYYDTNPTDGTQVSQFGAYSHGLNTDLQPNAGLLWSTTSTTSNTIGVGNKTFTVANTGLPAVVGQSVVATAGPNQMLGSVVSYIGTTLIINVTTIIGSGTFNAWVIQSPGVLSAGPGYKDVEVIGIPEFMDMINAFNPTDQNVFSYTLVVDENSTGSPMNFTVFYRNDRQPSWCTIISNNLVLFDSFDATQDSTLQASKTECMGWIIPAWENIDTFIPPLDEQQFPLLLAEAKTLAFRELKNTVHEKGEREVKRQLAALQKFKQVAYKPHPFDLLPNYGRRLGTGGYAIGSSTPRLH